MASGAYAQIPNGGFENWTDMGTYQDPTDWITLNAVPAMIPGSALSCEQGSPGAIGAHYATVTTRNITGIGIWPGIIVTGDIGTGNTGFAYTGRPSALTAQLQYGIQQGDSGIVMVYLTKWNTATQQADSIGGGALLLMGSVGSWTTVTVPIEYFSGANPDTAYVAVASSFNSPVAGSFVKVDGLGFGGTADVAEQAMVDFLAYPTPTRGLLNVAAQRPFDQVEVLDMTGRSVQSEAVHAGQATLDLSDLMAGRYLVRLTFANGDRQVRSIIKQ